MWGPDWPAVRAQWVLDPSVIFLNHGSFGACPRSVLDAQTLWRQEMERQPVDFLWRRLRGLIDHARGSVAEFLSADREGIAFVRNATTGVSTVLAGLSFRPGDRVVMTDHAYPAVLNAARRATRSAQAELDVVPIPLPLGPPEEIVDRVAGATAPRTRLVLVEHVTSPTGAVFPIERIVAACHDRGAAVLVDAAHAPGMLRVDLSAMQPDFWTGNFHKWVCAPKGSAALYVSAEHRRLLPLVTSHDVEGTYHQRFDWLGSDDPTPWLTVPDAIAFMDRLGWDRVWTHNHRLVLFGRDLLSASLGVQPPVPTVATGSMALVELPEGIDATKAAAEAVQARLYERSRIEVPFVPWNGRVYVRLSAQVYNRPSDYEHLADALPDVLPR